MNVTVKKRYEKLKDFDSAFVLNYGIENESEIWKLVCSKTPKKGNSFYYSSAKAMIKYIIRTHYRFGKDRKTLREIKDIKDKFSTRTIQIFSGKFSYENKLGGFVPWFFKKKVSVSLVDYYVKKFENDVLNKWNTIKKDLYDESGNPPSLIYKFDKAHVYFMRNKENGNIKIGASIHPKKRKKEIQRLIGKPIEILKIISAGGFKMEKKLHSKFREYNIHGEWFTPSKKLMKYINKI